MELQQLINSIETSPESQEKVASAGNAAGALAAALEKTASTEDVAAPVAAHSGNAVNDLMKVAEQMVGTEKQAEVAHMQLLGQVFADSAISKFASYDAQAREAAAIDAQLALQQEQVKMASAQQMQGEGLMKIAAEQGYADVVAALGEEQEKVAAAQQEEELMKIAAEIGYSDVAEGLQKEAADAQAGYDAGLQEIHDACCGEFLKAAAVTEMVLNKYQQAAQ